MKNKACYVFGVVIIVLLCCVLILLSGTKGIIEKYEGVLSFTRTPHASDYPHYAELMVDNQYVRLDMNAPYSLIELPTLNCEVEIGIESLSTEHYTIWFDDNEISGGTLSYKIKMLDKNYAVPIKVMNNHTGLTCTFYLATYPSTIPAYTTVGQSHYEGDYYLTSIGVNDKIAMKVGQDGRLKYYQYNTYGVVADFKKVVSKDGIRYLLFRSELSPYYTKGVSQSGYYSVMDENYHEINRLYMKQTEHVPANNYPVDQHDCLYISDSEYYLISYVDKNVYNIPDNLAHKECGSLVSAAVIQGIRNGEVFFEWDSTDYPELYELSVEYNDYTNSLSKYAADYMHINSISLDPKDGNLVASFRDIDTVMKINTQNSEIMWKLSGLGDDFNLAEDQKTSRQHYAYYTDLGSLLVFDNGNQNGQTRIVEYWLDEDSKSLSDYKTYQIDGYFSPATGSVQRLDTQTDTYLIGWGARMVSDEANALYPQFSEIDFTNGKTLFEFRFTDYVLSTYRCVKCR